MNLFRFHAAPMRRMLPALLLCCSFQLLRGAPAFAADHRDAPGVLSDPASDINDIFAWMQNGDRINLVMTVFPFASADSVFSDSVRYVFRISSLASYGGRSRDSVLACSFLVDQRVTCDIDGEIVIGNAVASDPNGVTSADGRFRIFTGLRNDPFFFASNNFNVVRRAVRDAASSLTFDEAGCPAVDSATQAVLVSTLTGSGGLPTSDSPPVNFFEPIQLLAIVIQADRTLFGNGPLYAVSGSTHRKDN